jgi:antitoxin MazE
VLQWYTIGIYRRRPKREGANVIKSLVKHGNSWALVIDRPILDLLKIDPESPLEITTDGQSMTISPISSNTRKLAVREARKKINARYGKAFKKLAE